MGLGFSLDDSVSMVTTAVTAAAVGAGVLYLTRELLFQNDSFASRWMTPEALMKKRRKFYYSKWQRALQIQQDDNSNDNDLIVLEEKSACQDFLKHVLTDTKAIVSIDGLGEGNDKNYCLWLKVVLYDEDNQATTTRYRVPLKSFGLLLAEYMESQLTTNTLAFVCDASAGLGTEIITTIMRDQYLTLGVPVLEEPVWLEQLAHASLPYSRDVLVRVLFGLVRLEAWRVRYEVGKTRTILVTLGAATVAPLGPLLHRAFPCERHVFVYDGCVSTVARARVKDQHHTPMQATELSSHVSDALAALPRNVADAAETWLGAINTYLTLKKNNDDYLPFCCKLGLLVLMGTREERRLALLNLLQYLTGSRSRPLPDHVLLQAQLSMIKVGKRQPRLSPFAPDLHRKLEECCFRHKGILIGDKTLPDTVVPAKEWTLKRSQRQLVGCLCCAPEPDDYDDAPTTPIIPDSWNGIDMTKPGAFALAFKKTVNGNI